MLMIKGLTKCVERLLMFVLTLPQHYTTEMLMMMNGSSSQLRLQRYELFEWNISVLPWQSWTSCSPSCWVTQFHPRPVSGEGEHLTRMSIIVQSFRNYFTCVVMLWKLIVLADAGDVPVVLLPVVEEGEDGVDEEEEDHAEDGDLLGAHIELWCCNFEWWIQCWCFIGIHLLTTRAVRHFISIKLEHLMLY